MVYGKMFFIMILTHYIVWLFLADVLPLGVNGICYSQADVMCLVGIMADVTVKRQMLSSCFVIGRCYSHLLW